MSMSQNQERIEPQFTANSIDNVAGRNWNLTGSNVSLNNQTQTSSCLDVINNNRRDTERLKPFLPGYRLAPDYETAISLQRNYRQNEHELHHLRQPSRVASDPYINIYSPASHPDVNRATAITDAIFGQQLQRTPDVTQTCQQHVDPNVLSRQMQMMRINKCAPNYPVNRVNSTSTPDLALGPHRALCHQAYVSGSSPDLLSTRAFPNSTQQPSIPSNTFRCRYPQNHLLHGSCEKFILPDTQTKSNILPQQIQKSYDGAYRLPNQQQGFVGSCHQLSGSRGSIEPIYENQADDQMRDRAWSIQSSAGMLPAKQQHQRQPLQTTSIRTQPNPIGALPNSQSLESIYPAARTSVAPIEQSELNRRHVQFKTINRAQSMNVLDSSTSGANSSDQRNSKEKKKRRWKFWGGRGKNSLSEKPKNDSSGWYKNKCNKYSPTKEEDSNSRPKTTGLPRLPLATTMSKEKLCQILETKFADPQLYIEFERIPKRKANANYSCALHDENRFNNSDPNFLPHDENRVRLTPTRGNRLGYYNASYVTATVGPKQRFYIASQSPHAVPALSTFLQCVWEADVYLLVQLSDEVHYVPPTCDKSLEYGQYHIWKEFSEITNRCITSKLRIYHTISRRYRSVWHLSYCEWGEQNCPKDVGEFLEFLEELHSVRLASKNEVPPGHNTNPPVMIHCSDGSGRTGVTLSADLLLYTLDHNQDLDMPRVLSLLREQRDNIVPSLAQYRWLCTLLISYLKRTRLI